MTEPSTPPASPILIVEDDLWNAKLVTVLLEGAGYRVTHAADPMGAIPLLRREPFSLVLLDQNMPGMDGLTLLGEIRKESSVPVMMLTGADSSELAVRALRLGAYDYLTKPVNEQKLLERVPQAIASGLPGEGEADRIAHYQIEHELGRGGMGVVYAAHDRKLERKVALKVLLPELATDPEYETFFLREARSAAQFAHPNIVTVYDAGRCRGRLYIAMERVEGQTLQSALQAGPALSLPKILDVGLQVASALEAVHESGMIHRDLKPGNIMVSPGLKVKVLDFGLVRPKNAGGQEATRGSLSLSGTLSYVPPELIRSGRVDARGDIYSLGVVLFELLSGGRAFVADTDFVLMMRIVEGEVSKPWSELSAVSPEASAVVKRMMAAAPEQRFASMSEVSGALRDLLTRHAS